MAESILQTERECYICRRVTELEKHHIFAGVANRVPVSEKYGLWVYLCYEHHRGKKGAQYDKDLGLYLKQKAQIAFEKTHTRKEWMELIRKNYLGTVQKGENENAEDQKRIDEAYAKLFDS